MKTSVHLPKGALAESVRGFVLTSTLDEAWPPQQPQLNHFPAMPFCGLTRFTAGRVALIDAARPEALRPMPDWIVFGPRTRPVTSLTLAPLRCVTVIFYPDAFALLTGRMPGELQDRDEAVQDWLAQPWQAWPAALCSRADDPAAQLAWMQDWLLPRWLAVRPRWNRLLGQSLRHAVRQGATAAVHALGLSERQVQRHHRSQVGLTPAQVRRLQRAQEALQQLKEPCSAGRLAALAAELGYADQAHLTRELREFTGLSPARLQQRLQTDPHYWPYRL